MMDNNFTQKEMLLRVMDKLEKIDDKLGETHELAKATNGKVKLHTKMIYGICGVLVTLAGWFISHLGV